MKADTMDAATEEHFDAFLLKHFSYMRPIEMLELRERMYDQYETDPEYYNRKGWWHCYDDGNLKP